MNMEVKPILLFSIMKLSDHGNELVWTANFSQKFPEALSTTRVEGTWLYLRRQGRDPYFVHDPFEAVEAKIVSVEHLPFLKLHWL